MSRTKSDRNGNTSKSECSVWTRAITANSEWPDKEEFLDVIYWSRQAIGIIVGIGWGLIPLKGFIALLFDASINVFAPILNSVINNGGAAIAPPCIIRTKYEYHYFNRFFLVNAGVMYVYFSNFQQVDEEEYGGAWELTKEGFLTSFAGFLVTWIIIYSGLHFD